VSLPELKKSPYSCPAQEVYTTITPQAYPAILTVVLLFLLLYQPVCSASPVVPVPYQSLPVVLDDLHRKNLQQAIRRSLGYLRSCPADTTVRMAEQKIPIQRLIRSLVVFQELLAARLSDQDLQEKIKKNFLFFQAAGTSGFNPDHSMLVTGYYQPVFHGSLEKKAPYLYPLYAPPDDLILKPATGSKKKQIGRMDGNHFTRYWTRQEIDDRKKAAGSELAWLKDPLDVFFLQVQGSGLIRLGDGTLRSIHYATSNGRPYRSIGKYMVQTGRMRLEDASMETIRKYIRAHPEELSKILFTNPSYIFFRWSPTHAAVGNLNHELTPGRSIAVDQHCFPAGSLAFLKTRQPVIAAGKIIGWKPVQRFVLVQDTGSAICGPGRVDLFQGTGEQAGLIAGSMKETGSLYFLLLRSDKP